MVKKLLNLDSYELEIRIPKEDTDEVNIETKTYSSEKIKQDYANILGNSECVGRELYERNKLGDKISSCGGSYLLLNQKEFTKLEQSFDKSRVQIPRVHKELLYRIYEAEEVVDDWKPDPDNTVEEESLTDDNITEEDKDDGSQEANT